MTRLELGTPSFVKTSPEIALDWHPFKNRQPGTYLVPELSKERVWWLCNKCGSEWEASFIQRLEFGCPWCSSLASLSPELLLDWDFEENQGKPVSGIEAKAGAKFQFKCSNPECGQGFEATVKSRDGVVVCPHCRKNLGYVVSGLERRLSNGSIGKETEEIVRGLVSFYKDAAMKRLDKRLSGQESYRMRNLPAPMVVFDPPYAKETPEWEFRRETPRFRVVFGWKRDWREKLEPFERKMGWARGFGDEVVRFKLHHFSVHRLRVGPSCLRDGCYAIVSELNRLQGLGWEQNDELLQMPIGSLGEYMGFLATVLDWIVVVPQYFEAESKILFLAPGAKRPDEDDYGRFLDGIGAKEWEGALE